MFKKRANYTKRNWFPLAMQILIPIAFIAFLSSGVDKNRMSDLPPLEISLSSYKQPVSVLETHDGSSDFIKKYFTVKKN